MPLPRKQYFALRDKLRKAGKWNPERQQRGSREPHNPGPSRGRNRALKYPQKNTLDNYAHQGSSTFRELQEGDPEFADVAALFEAYEEEQREGIEELPVAIPEQTSVQQPQGKLTFMSSKYERKTGHISYQSGSDTSDDELREISKRSETNNEIYVEAQDLWAREELPGSPVSVFYKRGDTPRETWEIERAFRDLKVSSGTRERIRIASVPETAGKIRDNCLIIHRSNQPVFWSEIKNSDDYKCELETYESYFQNYNSLAVVMRCLPDCNVTTVDIFQLLVWNMDDPFAIICEKSDQNVIHWHMIWFTSKRSDNAKRTLQKMLIKLPSDVSIAVQQTKSAKHLCRYMLKQPITLGIGNSDSLMKYFYALMNEPPVDKAKNEDNFSNAMVKDIITSMREHNKYTLEELLAFAPNVMLKYLHKPNIDSIVQNCKLFLHRPTDIDITYQRILHNFDIQDFFPIWVHLCYQGIDPEDFCLDFFDVMFKIHDKCNVLTLKGPSNCGKTYFIKCILELMNYGEVVAGGNFMFQNCVNKELLIWEEPIIGTDYVDICKKVMEGMTTQVNIKFKSPQTLYRTPMLITTNKDVWHYCSADEVPFKNRMFIYNFFHSMPPEVLKSSFLRNVHGRYRTWLTNISEYLSERESDFTAGIESSPPDYCGPDSPASGIICQQCGEQCCVCNPTDNYSGEPSTECSTGVNDLKRSSGDRSESEQRPKRARFTVHYSTTADDCGDGPGTSTGNCARGGSDSKKRFALHTGNYQYRGNRGFATRNLIGSTQGNSEYSSYLRQNITQLLDTTRRYPSLKKIHKEVEADQLQPGLDRALFDPLTKYHWMSLLLFGYNLSKAVGFF